MENLLTGIFAYGGGSVFALIICATFGCREEEIASYILFYPLWAIAFVVRTFIRTVTLIYEYILGGN